MASLSEFRTKESDKSHVQKSSLYDLPNEILVHILDLFQTAPLLQCRAVSHRFQNLIIRIVHSRLLRAASLEDRKLILECYHPSAQYTEPYLYCDYLGTPGLSEDIEGQGRIYQIGNDSHSGPTLRNLYSCFRPTRKDPEPRLPRSHPAGDIPGSRTSEAAASKILRRESEIVKQNVTLEPHELFSQLCFSAALVQIGPRRGVFTSSVDAIETKTIRIWRKWLADRAKEAAMETATSHIPATRVNRNVHDNDEDQDQMIWVDQRKIAGLRLKVTERTWRQDMPVLIHKDEDQAANYSLQLEELMISTTHLMLAVERSLLETGKDSGRAMVFGSFATAPSSQQAPTDTAG